MTLKEWYQLDQKEIDNHLNFFHVFCRNEKDMNLRYSSLEKVIKENNNFLSYTFIKTEYCQDTTISIVVEK